MTCLGCIGHIALLVCIFIFGILFLGPKDLSPPTPPTPPPPQAATFYSADGASPLVVTLSGGSYDFSYEHATNFAQAASGIDPEDIFYADMDGRTTRGDIDRATVIIINGSVGVHIGSLGSGEALAARITTQGGEMKRAVFNKAAPATGPPERKRVIVIGTVKEFDLGSRHGNSITDLHVLELDPTPQEDERYRWEESQYQERKRDYERRSESRPEFRPEVRPRGR